MKSVKNVRYCLLVVIVAVLVLGASGCGGGGPASDQATEAPVAIEKGEPKPTQAGATAEAAKPSNTPKPTGTPKPTKTSKPTPIPPTPTPERVGMSRSNPYPSSQVVHAPNWDVQVLEVVRGDEAWKALQAANQFNEPAPEGMEYILVKLLG